MDTETTGLDPWHGDKPFAVSFCNEKGKKAYFEWPVDPFTRKPQPVKKELEMIAEIMMDKKITKIFKEASFDVRMLDEAYDIETRGRIEEVGFAAHMCNSLEPSYGLKQLSSKYLDFPVDDVEEIHKIVIRLRRKAKKKSWTIAKSPYADYWLPKAFNKKSTTCEYYCCRDTERTMLLWFMYEKVMKELDVRDVYEREMELWPITYAMISRGVRVDIKRTDEEIRKAEKESRVKKRVVDKAAWKGFNVNSPQQLGKLVYDGLGLPVLKRTVKTGARKTDIKTLGKFIEHPVIKALFEYKAAEKAVSSWFSKYKSLSCKDRISKGERCIHPRLNQVKPNTGRYSCQDPNLQNVADDHTSGGSIPIQARMPLGPRRGYRWYSVDYDQLELRILADFAQEKTFLKAFKKGHDVHVATANRAWGSGGEEDVVVRNALHVLELDGTGKGEYELLLQLYKRWGINYRKVLKVSKKKRERLAERWIDRFDRDIVKAEKSIGKKNTRRTAKNLNYCKIYGGGVNAVCDLIFCEKEEAYQFIHEYDRAFPGVAKYLQKMSREGEDNGFVTNIYGRRLSVDPKKSYRACNYIVQSSAADLLKRSMIRCAKFLMKKRIDAHLVLTVHDELIFEIHKSCAKKSLLRSICKIMADHEGHFNVETPVTITRVVKSWNKKKKVKL